MRLWHDWPGWWCRGSRITRPRRAGWADYLRTEDEKVVEAIRRQTMTGRPSGSKDFIARLEGLLGRLLHPQKRGPKTKEAKDAAKQA